MLSEELVNNLVEELVSDEVGILLARDDDAADAPGAIVGMNFRVWT